MRKLRQAWRLDTIVWGCWKEGTGSTTIALFPACALKQQHTTYTNSRKHCASSCLAMAREKSQPLGLEIVIHALPSKGSDHGNSTHCCSYTECYH